MPNIESARAMMASWASLDTQMVMNHFSDDPMWHNMPIHPAQGVDEVRAMVEIFVADTTWFRSDIINIAETPDGTVLLERMDHFRLRNGRDVSLAAIAAMQFVNGRVSVWREYFDWMDYSEKVGNSALAEKPTDPRAAL